MLIAEFIFNLNVAYYQEGNMVVDRKQIAKNLILKSHGLEILSTLILILTLIFPDLQTQKQDSTLQNLIFLLFLVHKINIDRIVTVYETAINLSKKFSSYLTLVKLLLFFFMLFIYLLVCGIGQENIIKITQKIGLIEQKFRRIVGINNFQFHFIMLVQLCLLLGMEIQHLKPRQKESEKKKLRTINSYMQRKNVPFTLQNQIRQYLDYFWQLQASEESEDEKQIIQQLPENLRDTLMIKANHSFFNKVSLFKDNFSIAFKQKLLKKINHIVVQILEDSNEKPNTPSLFYIEEGTIEVYINQKLQQCIRQVNKQQVLEIDNFIIGTTSTEIFKSIGLSKLLILDRNDFMSVISQFPEDFETFCRLKDDLIFNQDLQLFEYKCIVCGMNSHKVINCAFIHYAPQKDFIIRKFNYLKIQKRRNHLRASKRSELNFLKKQISIITYKIVTSNEAQNKQQQKSLTQSKNSLVNPQGQITTLSKPLKDFTEMQSQRSVDQGEKFILNYNRLGIIITIKNLTKIQIPKQFLQMLSEKQRLFKDGLVKRIQA
ncbi:unnamed protein product [Paramecium sonneborni]|uniref:Cyclic nucleotide-binding domain-containing protein n=1 Tax=Paramecium sonneborni TaxID=65129 RepID=A0A8S1MVE7_9CILI|nr:unnamed protein product [Paramecium sonneborni]